MATVEQNTERIHGYCGLCISRCGSIAVVKNVSLLKSHPPRLICILRTDRLFRRSWSDGSESSLGH